MQKTARELERIVFRIYGKSPKIKILDFLLSFPKNEFTSTEIIDDLGMSRTTFYKYFTDMLDIGMVKVNPKSNQLKLFSINLESPLIQNMQSNIDYVSEKIADQESLKLKIEPLEIKTIQLDQLDKRIIFLRKLQRQTKTEIKKLEMPIEESVEILNIIMNNPYCTPTTIMKMTNIPQATVFRTLNLLIYAKIIYPSGLKINTDGKYSRTYYTKYNTKYYTKYNTIRLEVIKKRIAPYISS